MKNSHKIIVALDTDDIKKAKKLVKTLWPRVKIFKIGLEFINTGKAPELIKYINKLGGSSLREGGKVFYDIKLNDIPSTVGKAVKVISKLGIWGLTVHAQAGKEAIRAAIQNRGKCKIIGVTVLTSFKASKIKIVQLTKMLVQEGVDGVVCSSKEAKSVKKFKSLKIITPGIRPEWADKNDQKRIATPKEALRMGADYLVIGRPITDPPKKVGSPPKALERIIEGIEN